MSPSVGTLTTDGVYSPPSSLSSETSTTITATSAANTNVFATMNLAVLPTGPIHIIMANSTQFAAQGWPWPFKDASGNVWQSFTGFDNGSFLQTGASVPPWMSTSVMFLYDDALVTGGGIGDMRFDIIVPNGNYNIVAKFAELEYASAGQSSINLEEPQGTTVYSNVNLYSAAGGKYKPVDFTLPATVNNGHLVFVIRGITGSFTGLSALEIDQVGGSGNPDSVQPAPPTNLTVIDLN